MKRHKPTVSTLILLSLVGIAVGAYEMPPLQTYKVTIENLSHGQALTPPLVVTHTGEIRLYQVGEPAGPAIQAIAENGDLGPLQAALTDNMAVGDVAVSDTGPLVPPSNPGGTDFSSAVTLMVHADRHARYLSFISMLICTNDGFTALNGIALPQRGSRVLFVSGYDAGTESNTEDFADLVPPCQGLLGVSSEDAGTGASNPDLAENGVIHYHKGIKGGNDLSPDVHGWKNPVAKITITRIDMEANHFVAPLSGAAEVGPVATYARGSLDLKIDWEHQAIHYHLGIHGLSGITQAHIHSGSASENGPPAAFVFGPSDATGLIDGPLARGTIQSTDLLNAYQGDFAGFVAALRQGNLYVNVHTVDNPAGAIRGQIGSAARPGHGKGAYKPQK